MHYAIIAAGEGSRLSKEGYMGLKPMVSIKGEMMIDRLISIFIENEAETIHVIVNENSDELIKHLNSLSLSVPLHIIVKNTISSLHSFYELLEKAGGVEEICLTTTDTIFNKNDFSAYIKKFKTYKDSDGLLAVTSFIDDESPLYIEFDENNRITKILDQSFEATRYISGGIYCLRKKALLLVPVAIQNGVSRMRNYQRLLIDKELALNAYNFTKIMDVDHVSDIAKAERFLNDIEY